MKELDDFAEILALDVLDSRVVALRGLPRSGRTSVLQRVDAACGASSVFVRGRRVTESNHRSEATRIEAELARLTESQGTAQLIIDDFGIIMRSTFGHSFQAAIRSVVVDGDAAHAIGCLVSSSLTPIFTQASGRAGRRGRAGRIGGSGGVVVMGLLCWGSISLTCRRSGRLSLRRGVSGQGEAGAGEANGK